ncbi:MAG: cation:proton antiporter [Nanoarchaeota archaeon]
MNLIITLISLLLITYLFTFFAEKIKISSAVALILSGLLLSSVFLKELFIGPNTGFIFNLGDIALICLMFLAGFESAWKILYKERKEAAIISTFSAITPFLLGFVMMKMLHFSTLVSSIVGICMSITAEATTADILLNMK